MTVSFREVPTRSRVTFEVYPSHIFGNRLSDVTYVATLDPQTALDLGEDIRALHANAFESLPVGTPDDPFQYDYVRIRTNEGKYLILGLPFIREDTLKVNTGRTLYMTFENLNEEQVQRIFASLAHNDVKPTDYHFQ